VPFETIEVSGFDAKLGEAWVIVERGESSSSGLVRRDSPVLDVRPASAPPLARYLRIGIEHVLGGVDHLLFVFGLLLVVRLHTGGHRVRRMLATVTSFTLAHSITLGLATLGHVTLPGTPVEIGIALSILLLAEELARAPGRTDASWTVQHPALVAFAFGLLHGFGFAGALTEIGMKGAAT
jgi:hypothetical protein